MLKPIYCGVIKQYPGVTIDFIIYVIQNFNNYL